jgi:hypothetical protein
MKYSFAIAALVATTIGLGAALPALAQGAGPTVAQRLDRAPDRNADPGRNLDPGRGVGPDRAPDKGRFMLREQGMGPAGLLMLACSPDGAENLDVALLRASYRLNLTAEQQKLFDTFRANALSTETSFADTCKASLPDRSAETKPDMLARLKAGLAIDQARLTALNSILPDFEALYNSLSDAQKASLLPHRGMGMGGKGMGKGFFHHLQPRDAGQDFPPAPPSDT